MVDLVKLTAANAHRWAVMKVNPSAVTVLTDVAKRLIDAKTHFQAVAARTGVPWFVIAVIDERETSENWNLSIAQGDHWNQKSRHVPVARGPFKSWDDAAYDALVNCQPHAARWKDWSAGGTLTLLEEYNGLGYAAMGKPSPYIWADTDQYVRGKYVADHDYDPTVVDHQEGCAALLSVIFKLDPSSEFK